MLKNRARLSGEAKRPCGVLGEGDVGRGETPSRRLTCSTTGAAQTDVGKTNSMALERTSSDRTVQTEHVEPHTRSTYFNCTKKACHTKQALINTSEHEMADEICRC